jgi:hypothetical protein
MCHSHLGWQILLFLPLLSPCLTSHSSLFISLLITASSPGSPAHVPEVTPPQSPKKQQISAPYHGSLLALYLCLQMPSLVEGRTYCFFSLFYESLVLWYKTGKERKKKKV